MGAEMAKRLLHAGYDLSICDPVDAAAISVCDHGAIRADTPAAASDWADIIALSLPGPHEVEQVVTGTEGILRAADPASIIIDFSTNAPTAVASMVQACASEGVRFIDAPVSGGVAKARTGELSIMVGAEPGDIATIQPILDALGEHIFHAGPTGAGTVAKLINNQLFLGAAVLVQEAYLTGAALGMDPSDLHTIVKASSGGVYAKLAPLLLSRRFDDVIFRLDIAAKDAKLVADAATNAGVDAPLTRAAADLYSDAVDAGFGAEVFHATLKELERRAGVEVPALTRKATP